MGFLSSLFKWLSSEPPKKTTKQKKPSKFSYTQKDAVRLTADLIEGISPEQREFVCKELSKLTRAGRDSHETIAKRISDHLTNTNWHWLEWDYWQPRCVKENLWGWHMMFCSPFPDELDWEKERSKIKPETIVNKLKAQEAKDLVKELVPEGTVLKTKADVLAFLKDNPQVFGSIRDKKIQDAWDSKPHRTEASKEEIMTLLVWTVWDRINFVNDAQDIYSFYRTFDVLWGEDHDKRFYEVALSSADNPWKHKDLLPNFPGGLPLVTIHETK